MNNIKIGNPSNCSSCGLCSYICPKKCISLSLDKAGFLRPIISFNKCVSCHSCEKACVFLNYNSMNNIVFSSFVACSKNKELDKKATSGGIASAITKYFVNNGGVVYGAAFDDNLQLKHIRVDNVEDAMKLSGSKYLISNISNVFNQIINDLLSNKQVAFFGTPCQVNAIERLIYIKRIKHEHLFLISIACFGNMPQSYFNSYIQELSSTVYNKRIINYSFREKNDDNIQEEVAYFQDGTKKVLSSPYGGTQYLSTFFSKVAFNESCFNCRAKSNNCADLLIGDYWGVLPEKERKKGEHPSLVLSFNSKGEQLLNLLENEINITQITNIGRNPNLFSSVAKPKKRKPFLEDLEVHGFMFASKKWCPLKKTFNNSRDYYKQKKKPNICVITENDLSNYGNRFQNYALCSFLEKNYLCSVRNLWPVFIPTPKHTIGYLIRSIQNYFSLLFRKYGTKWIKRRKKFIHFAKRWKKDRSLLLPIKGCSLLNKRFDYFVLGSDQVINTEFGIHDYIASMSFCEPYKRITYAVSAGKTILNKEQYPLFHKNIPFFAGVSFREKETLENLDIAHTANAKVNLDPAFLFTKKEWTDILAEQKAIKTELCLQENDYLFVYWLGQESKEIKDIIENFVQKHSLKLIYVRTNNLIEVDNTVIDAGPLDFIHLIKGAKYVISKSYHGFVMSLIFHKPFIVVADYINDNLDIRYKELANKFGIRESRFSINNLETISSSDVNWDLIDETINRERKNTLEYFDCFLKRRK